MRQKNKFLSHQQGSNSQLFGPHSEQKMWISSKNSKAIKIAVLKISVFNFYLAVFLHIPVWHAMGHMSN